MSLLDGVDQLRRFAEAVKLTVLVWGPGAGGGEHSEKRTAVRRRIKECFPNADVVFSEEIDLSTVLPGASELSEAEQELWHLGACDVCVVLDTSKGAGEEIAHFASSQFAYKLLILTSEKYANVSSFPASLRQGRNQLFYEEHEYSSCSLTERVLARVRHVALGKVGGLRV